MYASPTSTWSTPAGRGVAPLQHAVDERPGEPHPTDEVALRVGCGHRRRCDPVPQAPGSSSIGDPRHRFRSTWAAAASAGDSGGASECCRPRRHRHLVVVERRRSAAVRPLGRGRRSSPASATCRTAGRCRGICSRSPCVVERRRRDVASVGRASRARSALTASSAFDARLQPRLHRDDRSPGRR